MTVDVVTFSIVIRKQSLADKQVKLAALYDAMETAEPLGQDTKLLSFGPHFGEEAQKEFERRLNALGLEYWDDYFDIVADFPSWCRVKFDGSVSQDEDRMS